MASKIEILTASLRHAEELLTKLKPIAEAWEDRSITPSKPPPRCGDKRWAAYATAQDQVNRSPKGSLLRRLNCRLQIANKRCCILQARRELGLASAARTESVSQERIRRAHDHLRYGAIEGVGAEWLDAGHYAEDIVAIGQKALLREIMITCMKLSSSSTVVDDLNEPSGSHCLAALQTGTASSYATGLLSDPN